MNPKNTSFMIVLICLGVGVAAVQDERWRFRDVDELKRAENENETLSEYMWNSATDLLQQTWNATFIAGVAAGNLDPNFYGTYTVQDAAWCREVAKLWRQLSHNASVPKELRKYANHSYASYQDSAVQLFSAWNIKDDGENNYGVNLQGAATNYVNTIRDAMLQNPPNVMIATFACVKLWANVTAELWSSIASTNPYKIWVAQNRGDSYANKQAQKIDHWHQKNHWYSNRTEAVSLFRLVMNCEINFFNLKH